MKTAARCGLFALFCVLAAGRAAAEPVIIPVTVATSGSFFCLSYAPCFAGDGTNQITFTNGGESATVTFTGVNQTLLLTNSLTTVTLGRFDVVGTDGFTFPLNVANPVLGIAGFRFQASNLGFTDQLLWEFGPGGGTTLPQLFGPWNFGVPTDVDPSPWGGVNFQINSPVLALNASTLMTAEAGLVPEPGTIVLLGSGLALLARRRYRARQASRV